MPMVDDIVRMRYVCRELDVPVWIFFKLCYAHKYHVFSNRYMDIVTLNAEREIPEYVKEFVDTILARCEMHIQVPTRETIGTGKRVPCTTCNTSVQIGSMIKVHDDVTAHVCSIPCLNEYLKGVQRENHTS